VRGGGAATERGRGRREWGGTRAEEGKTFKGLYGRRKSVTCAPMPGLGWGMLTITSPAYAQGALLLPASPFAGSGCSDCVEDALNSYIMFTPSLPHAIFHFN
jgi:hypothetical protein